MKKTSQFVNNIKQKRPLWGTQEQLEIETENYSLLRILRIILSLAKQSQGFFQEKKITVLLFAVCPRHSTSYSITLLD